MSIECDIAYCDSSVNPTSGCAGCELWNQAAADRGEPQICYAGQLHQDRLAKSLPQLYAPKFNEVRAIPGRMKQAAGWRDLRGAIRTNGKYWLDLMPRVIFVGDMADVFSPQVDPRYLQNEVFHWMKSPLGQRHIWLMLTKQAGRALQMSKYLGCDDDPEIWPDNVWMGVSVTGKSNLDHRLRPLAYMSGPRVRWLSLAPLRGQVDLRPYKDLLDWVVVEGESGTGTTDIRHLTQAVSQCLEMGIPVFTKQIGSNPVNGVDGSQVNVSDRAGRIPLEWPRELRVQQMPAWHAQTKPGTTCGVCGKTYQACTGFRVPDPESVDEAAEACGQRLLYSGRIVLPTPRKQPRVEEDWQSQTGA